MKTIDYESILCTVFNCNKFSIPLHDYKKAKVIEAMQEAVRLSTAALQEEIDNLNEEIGALENNIAYDHE